MLIRAVIVEDEAPSMERLKTLLGGFKEVQLIGEASDGPDGVKLIDTVKPDVAFLDIQLPVFTGFEILRRIRHQPYIVFITAYDAYAIQAFEANAVDYLLKPTSEERLSETIHRIRERQPQKHLLAALEDLIHPQKFRDKFTVRMRDTVLFIPVDDIYSFTAEDKYVFIHTHDQKYLIDVSLKNLQTGLDPDVFVRIHKSVIVHIGKINRIRRRLNGQFFVQLADSCDSNFDIGRTCLAQVREKLKF